jgi:hypothetical protein
MSGKSTCSSLGLHGIALLFDLHCSVGLSMSLKSGIIQAKKDQNRVIPANGYPVKGCCRQRRLSFRAVSCRSESA